MYADIKINSDPCDAKFASILASISKFNCSDYFSNHINNSQSEQSIIVKTFQNNLRTYLSENHQDIDWQVEYKPNIDFKDSIDIFGIHADFVVVIELDKHRADQVSKKFISRMAIINQHQIYYISLCYPGTQNMNASECEKYFNYCSIIAKRINAKYAGLIIEK